MATLTADELADIRLITGARESTVISDTAIQNAYNEAGDTAPTTALVEPYTYVSILQRMWGYYGWLVDQQTDHGDQERLSQRQAQIKARLDYWSGIAGLGDGSGGILGTISTGVIGLGIDTTCDDEWSA